MSLSSTTSRNNYLGNNSTDTYNFTFRILDEADLRVTVRDTSDVETELVLNTDYTVTGVGASGGGSITLLDGNLATDYVLSIRRVIEIVQETDIRNQGQFFPEIHEDQFDRSIMIAQQQQDELDRSMKLAETVDPATFSPTLPADLSANPGATMMVNPAGNGFITGPTADAITQAAADAASAGNHKTTAQRWANLTSGTVIDAETSVDSLEYSAKEYAQGIQASTGGSSKDWASKTSAAVSGGEYSSKEWAKGTQTRGVANGGSSKDWANYTGGTVDDTEYSAKKYAADAALSAAQAAASASASMWSDVQYLTSASSPKAIIDADTGVLFEVDCSGGNVVINLPAISGLTLSNPWAVGFKKTDSSSNTITINRDGADTIDGNTSKVISRQYAGCTLVPDIDPSPDRWTSLSFGEVPISGAIVGTTDTQTLSNKTYSDPITIAEVSTPTTPSSGFGKIYFKSDGSLYQLNDDGTESKVGSGTGGANNIVTNGTADEAAASIFTAYADAAGTSPVDGDGGSPNVTTSITSSTPITGTKSFLLTKDAVDRQGQGWSVGVTIPLGLRAKMVNMEFDYIVNSGTFVAGSSSTSSDVTVWFYDITNSQVIQPSNYKLFSNSSTNVDRFSGQFQMPYNCASGRFIFHVGSTSASAYELKVDNLSLSENIKQYGVVVTDWQSYTPSNTDGFGTITSVNLKWRRVGSSMEIQGGFTSGTVTGSAARIELPSSYTIGGTTGARIYVGEMIRAGGSRVTVLGAEGRTYITFGSGASSQGDVAGSSLVGSTEALLLTSAIIPIAGWSTNVQTSDQADGRIVAFGAHRNGSNQTGVNPNSSDVKINVNSVTPSLGVGLDTHGTYDTTNSRYIVSVSGIYTFNASINVASTNTLASLYRAKIFKNGVAITLGDGVTPTSAGSAFCLSVKTPPLAVSPGDYFEVYLFGAGNNSVSTLTVEGAANQTQFGGQRLSGLSSIASGETVAAITSKAAPTLISGTIAAGTALYAFDKIRDTHGSYSTSTGKFTCPVTGLYEVVYSVRVTGSGSGGYITTKLLQTGSSTVTYTNPSFTTGESQSNGLCSQVKAIFNCQAGDLLFPNVESNYTTAALTSDIQANYFHITKLGN